MASNKPKAKKRKPRATTPRSRRAAGATPATKVSAPAPSAVPSAPETGSKPEKRGRGRPTKRSTEAADAICTLVADGRSLRSICRHEDSPISLRAVMEWLAEDQEFAQQYARAREAQADALADEIVEIADTEPDPARARVRVDARKWVASKLKPKKYGDKVDVEHSGGMTHRIEKIERIIVDPADTNG